VKAYLLAGIFLMTFAPASVALKSLGADPKATWALPFLAAAALAVAAALT